MKRNNEYNDQDDKYSNKKIYINDKENDNDLLKFNNSLKDLYIHETTLNCALNILCIPCLYKINPLGKFGCNYIIPPNQRPENCPRSKKDNLKYNGLYKLKQKILTVGDGDFSFSLSICTGIELNKYKKSKKIIYTTSHESNESVLKTYPHSKDILDELTHLGAVILHEVDATNLQSNDTINSNCINYFDIILWNFPCVRISRGADGQVNELEENKILLKGFFNNVRKFLKENGEIHVTHKTIEPFNWCLPSIYLSI
jgi:25S rRNA (uracil2634-N3)-methyltransferase